VQAAIDLGIMFAVHEADALLVQFSNGKRGGRLVGYGLSDSAANGAGQIEFHAAHALAALGCEYGGG
jgi:hypothetical protein